MSTARATAGIALLALAACTSSPTGSPGVQVFNPELRAAFGDVAGTMAVERTPLEPGSGATISTCDEYLRHADAIDREDPELMPALQDYVICDSVHLLQRAHAVAVAPGDAGPALASRLDFRSFRSSRGPRITGQAHTFEALVDAPLVIDANAATLDTAEWFLAVERVAAADFDGDGREDWLLWIGDDANVGTYQSFNALLVHGVTNEGLLPATPVR